MSNEILVDVVFVVSLGNLELVKIKKNPNGAKKILFIFGATMLLCVVA